ncbi:hypothetical protein M3Y96_00212800 [Aphelenchoides besseyi]|nr:hypothetical protein M3Y96_00212800 [Aphelenchoides besseyi]
MKIENTELLTQWIKKRISEICDAEPVAFAKYVVALLKKDDSEDKLRSICCDQLNVFLAEGTDDFVNNLFETLESQAYLRGADKEPSPPIEKDTEPMTTQDSPPKSSVESQRTARRRISPPRETKDETRSAKEPATRPTQDRRPYNARDRDRRSRSRSPYSSRRRPYPSRRSRSKSRSPNYRRDRDYHRRERSDRTATTNSSQPQRRTRCPDFEEKGFCRRGDKCQYEHGPDAIVLDDNNVDFRPDYNGNPPPPGVEASRPTTTSSSTTYAPSSTNVQQAEYNPEAPALSGAPSIPAGFVPNFSVPPPPTGVIPGMIPVNPYLPTPQMMAAQMGSMRVAPSFRGFGRGRGRGRFGQFSERVQPNKSTTIEVRRIPPEVNKLGIINNHFSQYGDITNIQISFDGSPDTALVTYAKLPDAQAAMKSTKPILDNRFIQVCWHKPPAPAPVVDPKAAVQATNGNVQPAIPLSTDPSNDKAPIRQLPQSEIARNAAKVAEENMQQRRKERQRANHLQEVYALKLKLYNKQVDEVKSLLERMTKITDQKAKGQCAQLVKTLEQTMKTTSNEMKEMYSEIQQLKNKQKRPASDDEESVEKPDQKKRAASVESINPNTTANLNESKKSEKNDEKNNAEEATAATDTSELADENTIRKLLQESDDDEEEQTKQPEEEILEEANEFIRQQCYEEALDRLATFVDDFDTNTPTSPGESKQVQKKFSTLKNGVVMIAKLQRIFGSYIPGSTLASQAVANAHDNHDLVALRMGVLEEYAYNINALNNSVLGACTRKVADRNHVESIQKAFMLRFSDDCGQTRLAAVEEMYGSFLSAGFGTKSPRFKAIVQHLRIGIAFMRAVNVAMRCDNVDTFENYANICFENEMSTQWQQHSSYVRDGIRALRSTIQLSCQGCTTVMPVELEVKNQNKSKSETEGSIAVHWRLAESCIMFDKLFFSGNFILASEALSQLECFSPTESLLRKSLLDFVQDRFDESELHAFLKTLRKRVDPYLKIRFRMSLGTLKCANGNQPGGVEQLERCLKSAKKLNLLVLEKAARRRLSYAYMCNGELYKAETFLQDSWSTLTAASSSVLEKFLCYATKFELLKRKIEKTTDSETSERLGEEALNQLYTAIEFLPSDSYSLLEQQLFREATLFAKNVLKDNRSANKFAERFLSIKCEKKFDFCWFVL